MEMFTYFQLFSFLPVLAFGAVFWIERLGRHGTQKRTTYLFLALVAVALVGILQTGAWVFRGALPFIWPQLFVLSSILYFCAFLFLEYAIHVKRIEESYLLTDFKKEMKTLTLWALVVGFLAVLVLASAPAWMWDHNVFPLNLFISDEARTNPLLAYQQQMRLVTTLFFIPMAAICFLAGHKVFELQKGVIRKREFPFWAQIIVTFILVLATILTPLAVAVPEADKVFLPIAWFAVLNLVFIGRLVEEFFFWGQFNLRSDRNRMEQRQYTQNLLIRRVIGSSDEEDKNIVKELMDSALEKAKNRTVVDEYRLTGLTVYRLSGNVLRIDDPSHVIGYCTPLADGKAIKNLDKHMLNDLILKTTYDITELRETMLENLRDFGKKMVKEAMTKKQTVVTSELPDVLKGLQRLAVVVPIFDSNNFMGFLTVFKDSFDKLYPGEKAVLEELAENLATVFALMVGKQIQRERNRLQGEMNTARTIQTSILPKKIQMPGYQVGTFMETASEVGGDVFDFIPSPFGTYFGIGDVSGHGLPAGMMAVISVAALHGAIDAARVLGKPLPLDQVYDTVNRVLCTLNRDRIGSDKFMTQNYFLANGGKIDHVGTHLIAVVWRSQTQTIEELPGLTDRTGFLGLSEYVVSDQSLGSFNMEKDDVLVLYSDGVSEAVNGAGTMFGLEGIKHTMVEHASKAPQEFIAKLLEDLRRHAAAGDFKKHGGHFTDDVTLVVLKKE